MALNAIEEIGSSEAVNLVAQATLVPELGDRRFQKMGQVNTRRYYLTQDGDLGQVNSPVVGQFQEQKRLTPENLEDFLCWGIEKFPAKHFMVVLKKHGLGFAANGSSVPLSAREVRATLERVEKRTGVKPDVLCWDSCNMQQWEVAYELKDRVAVMTGSPEAIAAVEFPYQTMLHNLVSYPQQQDARTLGKTIVQSYAAEAPQTTQVAVDMSKLPGLARSLREFVDEALKLPPERLYTNLLKSASFEPKESLSLAFNFRDLAGFLQNVVADPAIAADVKTRATAALEGLRGAQLDRNLHPQRAHLKNLSSEAGPSAFMPWKQPNQKLRASYGELAWAQDTGWDRLLDRALQAGPASEKAPLPGGPLKLGLYAYKKYVSPYLLTDCPYQVSCSEYAREAVQNLGAWQGAKWAFMRLISCQDGVAGGHDDPPGSHCRQAQQVLPELTFSAPPALEKSEGRRRAENWLFGGARLAGQMVGGAVAAVAGGLTGAALGGVWGFRAGAGNLEQMNNRLRVKYGDTKVNSLERLEKLVAAPGAQVGRSLGPVAGALAGAVSGAALGLLGGGLFSYRFFGGFAALAAQNMAKDSLGELPVHYQTEQILKRGYQS
ncbi:MAG: membrane protein insertion efficiency factor YidD [Vulcanimicrobiota bacterium]